MGQKKSNIQAKSSVLVDVAAAGVALHATRRRLLQSCPVVKSLPRKHLTCAGDIPTSGLPRAPSIPPLRRCFDARLICPHGLPPQPGRTPAESSRSGVKLTPSNLFLNTFLPSPLKCNDTFFVYGRRFSRGFPFPGSCASFRGRRDPRRPPCSSSSSDVDGLSTTCNLMCSGLRYPWNRYCFLFSHLRLRIPVVTRLPLSASFACGDRESTAATSPFFPCKTCLGHMHWMLTGFSLSRTGLPFPFFLPRSPYLALGFTALQPLAIVRQRILRVYDAMTVTVYITYSCGLGRILLHCIFLSSPCLEGPPPLECRCCCLCPLCGFSVEGVLAVVFHSNLFPPRPWVFIRLCSSTLEAHRVELTYSMVMLKEESLTQVCIDVQWGEKN
ncbi:hypothetical protein Taro_033627 [Colocasia esculenta]|uniref:Uncharacterized protein n=1 Tax=Colocasia esculenta TaxID=4460 RepID=A0A843VUA1_COLES|nr:hypothetical protein [Colocasia esculenta]